MTKELLAEVKQGLQRLQDELNKGHTRAFLEYLQTLGRFHQYSFHNSILIWLQKPDATLVAGFRRWQELGRWVRKGEKGIRILAPIIKKVVKEDADGLPLEVEEVVGFRTAYVFDISQTDGKPLPDRLIAQGPESLYPRLKALCPFPVEETEDHNLIQRIASAVHSILHRLEAKPVQVPEAA